MIDINNFPNNRDEFVGAEPLMAFLHGRTSGVFSEADSPTVTAAQGKMAVKVSDGYGWIADANKNGCAWWIDTKAQTGTEAELTIAPANSVNPRTDRVIIEWTTTLYQEHPKLRILQGAVSASAVPPALTNTGTVRQISLARVRIPAGTTSITPSLITDERLDSRVCGLVTFDTDIDTRTMQAQFDDMRYGVKQESDALLDSIQQELASITSGKGFDLIPIRVHDLRISTGLFNTFSAQNDTEIGLKDMGYEYRAAVPVSGVIESMTPYITMSLPTVENSGSGFANQFACYNGGFYVYADSVPMHHITALTAEFRKAVV